MCVIQHNREGIFRELYQIENTLIRFISGIFALLERFSQTSQGYSVVRDVSTGSRYSNRSRTSVSTLWRRYVYSSSSTGVKTSPQLLHRYPLSGFDSTTGKSIPQQIGHGSSISISACSISPERFSNSTITGILLLMNNTNAPIDVIQGHLRGEEGLCWKRCHTYFLE